MTPIFYERWTARESPASLVIHYCSVCLYIYMIDYLVLVLVFRSLSREAAHPPATQRRSPSCLTHCSTRSRRDRPPPPALVSLWAAQCAHWPDLRDHHSDSAQCAHSQVQLRLCEPYLMRIQCHCTLPHLKRVQLSEGSSHAGSEGRRWFRAALLTRALISAHAALGRTGVETQRNGRDETTSLYGSSIVARE